MDYVWSPTLQLKILVRLIITLRELNWRLFLRAVDAVLTDEQKTEWGLDRRGQFSDFARYETLKQCRDTYVGRFSWIPVQCKDGSGTLEELFHPDPRCELLPDYELDSAGLKLFEDLLEEYRFQELRYACESAMSWFKERFGQAVVLTLKKDEAAKLLRPPVIVLTCTDKAWEWRCGLEGPDVDYVYSNMIVLAEGLVFEVASKHLPRLYEKLRSEDEKDAASCRGK